jgi:hypothetical protein
MAVLLILASPHVLLEPSGAGARPVHPIRVIPLPRNNSYLVEADVGPDFMIEEEFG